MANTNAPFGFRPIMSGFGSAAPTMSLIKRKAVYSTALYRGDLVKDDGSGYVTPWTASSGIIPTGVVWGVEYKSVANGYPTWSTYSTGGDISSSDVCYVYLIPIAGAVPQQFMVQSYSTQITLANIGDNIDVHVGTATVAGRYGRSGMTIDPSTLANTATLPFRITGLLSDISPDAPGTYAGSYNIAIVTANTGSWIGVH